MPRRPVFCQCTHCRKQASTQNQKGVLFPSSAERSAHLAGQNVRRNLDASQSSDNPIARPSHLQQDPTPLSSSLSNADSLSAEVFVSTLLDPGPDIENQPFRHWTSQDDFQHSRNVGPGETHNTALDSSIDDIIQSVNRLSFTDDHLANRPSVENGVLASVHRTRSVKSMPDPRRSPSLPRRSQPRRERNKANDRCLKSLDRLLDCIKIARSKLLTPSHIFTLRPMAIFEGLCGCFVTF